MVVGLGTTVKGHNFFGGDLDMAEVIVEGVLEV